jgi:mannitol/fructose-specific phosphotransferase system IIA component (Ntr-type)
VSREKEEQMDLFSVLRHECIAVRSSARDKAGILNEIAQLAADSPLLTSVSRDTILQGIKDREALGSTGFGNGIAIPHCRIPSIDNFVVGLVTAPDGVDFDAMDEMPVRLFVFVVAPASESDLHVRLLSGISQVLSIPGAVEEMVGAETVEGLVESFLRHVKDQVDTSDAMERSMFHVFVQDEQRFKDILQVICGIGATATVVLEVENTSAYLQRLPMFAGFWTDTPKTFSRLIIALVNKDMANETIRRIERVTGDLNKQTGVLLAVQNMFYCAGGLNP